MNSAKKTVAFDFDGTLAKKTRDGTLGTPVRPMVDLAKQYLAKGDKVVVFTARNPAAHKKIADWTEKHLGKRLEVTNVKRPEFSVYYDDRAKQVVPDTGKLIQ